MPKLVSYRLNYNAPVNKQFGDFLQNCPDSNISDSETHSFPNTSILNHYIQPSHVHLHLARERERRQWELYSVKYPGIKCVTKFLFLC